MTAQQQLPASANDRLCGGVLRALCRRRRGQRYAAALLWLCTAVAAAPLARAATQPLIEPPSGEVLAALRALRVTLVTGQPSATFELHYSGPITRPVGPLCYHFAGYNETCVRLSELWLTPASAISLHAPGGVPLDLLTGYQLLVRFPHWTEETFRPQHAPPAQQTSPP